MGLWILRKDKRFKEVSNFDNAVGFELRLKDPDIYPIKRHPQFEDRIKRIHIDPLAGITSTISRFNDPADQAWIPDCRETFGR